MVKPSQLPEAGTAGGAPRASEHRRPRAAPPATGRPLNRLRLLVDRRLTAANALDRACDWHGDGALFHPDAPLPYDALAPDAVTPRMLLSFANRLGNVLLEAGLERDDRVAVFKTNAVDYFFVSLAVVRAGGIAVPINPLMPADMLHEHLRRTGAHTVLTDADVFAASVVSAERFPTVRSWIFPHAPSGLAPGQIDLGVALGAVSDELSPVDLLPESPALIAHTSATTGAPKAVVSTSGSLVAGVKGHCRDTPIRHTNRIAVAGHFSHLVCMLGFYASMLGNMPVWAVGRHDPEHILELLERERINVFFAFPDVYHRLHTGGLDAYPLRSMRVWIATAAPTPESLKRAFCRKGAYLRLAVVPFVRSVFIDALGTTEIGFAALRRFTFSRSGLKRPRLVGRPSLGGPRVRVVDDRGRRAGAGKIGRLAVKGPTVFERYWGGAAAPEPDKAGWWLTGDVAYRDRLGRFHHLDREDDVVPTTHGDALYTLEAEELLTRRPDVRLATIVGLPDGAVGLVVPAADGDVDPVELRAWLNAHTRSPVEEIRVIRWEDLPRGPTGKVLKRVLRERLAPPRETPAVSAG